MKIKIIIVFSKEITVIIFVDLNTMQQNNSNMLGRMQNQALKSSRLTKELIALVCPGERGQRIGKGRG